MTPKPAPLTARSPAASLIPTALVAFALFALLMKLGFWQLDRAREKTERAAEFAARLAAAPVDLANFGAAGTDALLWRQVHGSGRYLDPVLLLDNRTRAGQAGFEVMSPFAVDGGPTVLVDRGWVTNGGHRERIPEISSPAGQTNISGFAGPEPATGLRLNAAADSIESLAGSMFRIQHVDLEQLAQRFQIPFMAHVVYLDEDAPHGFDRQWVPPGDGSAKHRAYAIQWFSMAAILVAIVAFLGRRKLEQRCQ